MSYFETVQAAAAAENSALDALCAEGSRPRWLRREAAARRASAERIAARRAERQAAADYSAALYRAETGAGS